MLVRILHSCIGVAFLSVLACIIPQVAHADDPERPALSPTIRRVLAWLPETTETVVVGQSFTIQLPDRGGAAAPTPVQSKEAFKRVPKTALGALNEPEMAKYLKPLAGKQVALALRGGRNYEMVSTTLPTYRTEGCAVVIFEKELGEASTEWIDTLRAGAQEVRKLTGRTVFVFPPTQSMRASRKSEWPGQLGVYLAVLNAETILCATSDKYLEQLLERVDTPVARRALPDDLPEWKHVNSSAPAWMLRHNSKGRWRRVIQGVTWTVTQDQIQAVYLPAAGEEDKTASQVHRNWQPEPLDMQPAFDVHPTIERLKDGTVEVSSTTENLNPESLFVFLMNLYYLEGQPSDPDNAD